MIRRLFPADKNHILMEVQLTLRDKLLLELVNYVKGYYLHHFNPLGLIDDTILEIQKQKNIPYEAFDELYHDLAAVYRFRYGEVQLELLFDGSTHYDKYSNEWKAYFIQSIKSFCSNKFFLKAVLDISVFNNHGHAAQLAGERLKYFLTNYFDLKVYKYRGVMEIAS